MSLAGKIIICTRPASSENELKHFLRERGATVIEMPMINIVQSDIDETIFNVFDNLSHYEWCVFTSKNGVINFFDIASKLHTPVDVLKQLKFAAFGSKTIQEIEKAGFHCDIKSIGKTSDTLLNELKMSLGTKLTSIILALGNKASENIGTGLPENIVATRINVYKTVDTDKINDDIEFLLRKDEYDLLVFTSPSGFRNFSRLSHYHQNLKTACIGETTAAEMLRLGHKPLLVSSMPDSFTFANEIESFFTKV